MSSKSMKQTVTFHFGQGSGLGQVEVVFKTVSVSNINVTDGYACRDDNCKMKMKVTFTQPVSSPKM